MRGLPFFLLLFLLPLAIASSSTGEHELGGFSAVRFQDESLSAGIFSQATLRLSTNARLLSAGAANDLPDGAYACPGQISPGVENSFAFARNNEFDARGPKPGNQEVPRQWQANEESQGAVQLDNQIFSGLLDNHDARLVSENTNPPSAEANSPARQNFLYMRELGDQNPQSGASYAGISCTGNSELQVGGQAAGSSNFAGGAVQFQPVNAQAGDPSFRVRTNLLDCAGVVQPLNAQLNGVFGNRKYVYYTDADDYRQSTDYTPPITIHIRNPQVSASGQITRINNGNPPQVLQVQTGEQAPIEISISNAAAGAPRRLRIVSVSSSNDALPFSANGLPSAYIDAGSSRTITGTLTANSAFNGQVQLLLNLESDGIVCDGSTPLPQVSLPLAVQITEPPQNYPDLQITQVALSDQRPAIGNEVRFTATIRNSGSANAGASVACMNITKADGGRLQTQRADTGAIAQGQQAQASFAYNPVQGPPGQNSYSIISDCDNQVNENANEENNRASGNFEAAGEQQEALPNIHLMSVTVPQGPEQGTAVQISARLENNGNQDTETPFDTCLELTAPSGAVQRLERQTDSLEIRVPVAVSFTNIPINEMGQYSAAVSADCRNDIRESNENPADNSITQGFTSVSPPPEELPNLRAQIIPIAAPENLFCPGDSVRINFTVANSGQAGANGLFRNRLQITDPDGSTAFNYYNLDGLAMGQESRVFSLNYGLPDSGQYLINATADYFGAIEESEENDNSALSDFSALQGLPNLRVSNISYDHSLNITTDTLLLVNVSVENNGCAGIGRGAEITLDSQIRNRPPAILTDSRSYQEGLAPGQAHVFGEIPFQLTQSFYGRNLFQAFADRGRRIDELDEFDNEGRWIFSAGRGQGGGQGEFRYCYIQSPSSPLYKSEDVVPVSVQYINYQPQEEVQFDCGNGEGVSLSCENDGEGGAACTSQSGCKYDAQGTYTARTSSPQDVSCSAELEVSLDDLGICSKYI